MNNQRTNPYLKSGIILLLSAIGGAILGIVLLFIFSYSNGNIETGLTLLTHTLQSLISSVSNLYYDINRISRRIYDKKTNIYLRADSPNRR